MSEPSGRPAERARSPARKKEGKGKSIVPPCEKKGEKGHDAVYLADHRDGRGALKERGGPGSSPGPGAEKERGKREEEGSSNSPRGEMRNLFERERKDESLICRKKKKKKNCCSILGSMNEMNTKWRKERKGGKKRRYSLSAHKKIRKKRGLNGKGAKTDLLAGGRTSLDDLFLEERSKKRLGWGKEGTRAGA